MTFDKPTMNKVYWAHVTRIPAMAGRGPMPVLAGCANGVGVDVPASRSMPFCRVFTTYQLAAKWCEEANWDRESLAQVINYSDNITQWKYAPDMNKVNTTVIN